MRNRFPSALFLVLVSLSFLTFLRDSSAFDDHLLRTKLDKIFAYGADGKFIVTSRPKMFWCVDLNCVLVRIIKNGGTDDHPRIDFWDPRLDAGQQPNAI